MASSLLKAQVWRISCLPMERLRAARLKLRESQILAVREVLVQRLRQDEPGQLGKISRLMAEAGVNIEVLYSDHANQLIMVVDNVEAGRAVSEAWTRESSGKGGR